MQNKPNQHALPLTVRCYCYETVTYTCNIFTSLHLDEAKLFTPCRTWCWGINFLNWKWYVTTL